MITLRLTLGSEDRWGELDPTGSGYSPMVSFYEYGDEPSGSIKKAWYFLTSWVTRDFSNYILHHGVS
jgi:hypothetical protein